MLGSGLVCASICRGRMDGANRRRNCVRGGRSRASVISCIGRAIIDWRGCCRLSQSRMGLSVRFITRVCRIRLTSSTESLQRRLLSAVDRASSRLSPVTTSLLHRHSDESQSKSNEPMVTLVANVVVPVLLEDAETAAPGTTTPQRDAASFEHRPPCSLSSAVFLKTLLAVPTHPVCPRQMVGGVRKPDWFTKDLGAPRTA